VAEAGARLDCYAEGGEILASGRGIEFSETSSRAIVGDAAARTLDAWPEVLWAEAGRDVAGVDREAGVAGAA
jgi:hypothetical protein